MILCGIGLINMLIIPQVMSAILLKGKPSQRGEEEKFRASSNFTIFLISIVLTESGAIMGFASSYMSSMREWSYIMSTIAFALFLRFFPK
ncbi:MAG: hypothetical protein H6619_06390 [Deltaproteobacteria bacterium]|nr:hypothetical protein [Deltaproteobacteria bacterium]